MRSCRILGGLVLVLSVTAVWAADEPKPPEGSAPTTVLARAVGTDKDGVTLQVRVPNMVAQVVTEKVKVPVSVEKIVEGKRVTEVQMVEQQRAVMRQRATGWRTVSVSVDGKSVSVYDIKGKAVVPDGLAKLLEDETSVLLSTNGKVDPFYLKTTKAGTLIVVMPPDRLYPAPRVGPGAVIRPVPAPKGLEKAAPPPPPGR